MMMMMMMMIKIIVIQGKTPPLICNNYLYLTLSISLQSDQSYPKKDFNKRPNHFPIIIIPYHHHHHPTNAGHELSIQCSSLQPSLILLRSAMRLLSSRSFPSSSASSSSLARAQRLKGWWCSSLLPIASFLCWPFCTLPRRKIGRERGKNSKSRSQ